MVLERLYSTEFLYKRKSIVLVLSIAFSVFGIAASLLLFGTFGPSLVSVAFTSLFLLAALKPLLSRIIDEPYGSLAGLRNRYRHLIIIFAYVFLGVFLVFSIFTLLMPSYATKHLFTSQESLVSQRTAETLFAYGTTLAVFRNNAAVFIVSFILSFLFGIGTAFLFILVWNASVVGVIFGAVAQQSALNPLYVFMVLALGSLPHIVLEILAYLVAGVTGESLSFYVLQDAWERVPATFPLALAALLLGLVLLFLAAALECSFAPGFINFLL